MGKKFINPVEKARKQAKKKESNKQKKQRFEARSLNLKGKDPQLIISELERLDKIQYNIDEPPKLNEKVIENKRKKLKDTLYRILGMYRKEDDSKYTQIKRLEMEYEAKKVQLVKKFEAVNSAKEVNLEEIPLPFCPDDVPFPSANHPTQDITTILTKSNLREPQNEILTISGNLRSDLKPPGCPSTVPPSIEELEADAKLAKDSKAAERDLDEFLKEVDQVEKASKAISSTIRQESEKPMASLSNFNVPPPLPPMLANLPSKALPPNSAPFPVLLNQMGLLNHPHYNKKSNMPIRPNAHLANKFNPTLTHRMHTQQRREPEKVSTSSTIEAKPQLRNLSADVTKFLPTSLRIKRQDNKKPMNQVARSFRQPVVTNTNKPAENKNKDTAYEEFMKELNGLI